MHVFNPQHIGGVASTFRWSLGRHGCQDPATAIRRADAPAFAFAAAHKGVEDGTVLVRQSQAITCGRASTPLRRRRYDLRTVAAGGSPGAEPHVPEVIQRHGRRPPMGATLAELRSEAHKTTATVRMVMSRALSFMADPALATCVLPAPGDEGSTSPPSSPTAAILST